MTGQFTILTTLITDGVKMKKSVAIILAAGRGKRMGSDIPKQFLEINGRPVIYYTIKAFEESSVDSIIIVTGESMMDHFRDEILKDAGFLKITDIVAGGSERYLSVANGLAAAGDEYKKVLIHDGARPLVTVALINGIIEKLEDHPAVIPGIPVKDTIKIIDDAGYVCDTPVRSSLTAVQTPQGFWLESLKEAYSRIPQDKIDASITDDACVYERFGKGKVYVTEGEENNIKVTTPGDLNVMKMMLG